MRRQLSIIEEKWQLAKPFVISRSSRTETATIKVIVKDGAHEGIGEGVANSRYNETNASLVAQIREIEPELANGLDRDALRKAMPAGAARNAVDCALWDLEAKQCGRDVGILSGLGWPKNLKTVQTISILSPDEMRKEAASLSGFANIKVKINAEMIVERIRAVQEGAPNSNILIDANESWSMAILKEIVPVLSKSNVLMIEQPLAAGQDDILSEFQSPIPIFADESCHTSADIPILVGKYQGVNIKLDKTGGLTEAIALSETAQKQKMDIMIGCMLGTSLGIAPAMFLASKAVYVDIDAPALLANDRQHGIRIDHGQVSPLNHRLWGGG